MSVLDYAQVVRAVDRGVFFVLAPGTYQGEPDAVWYAEPLGPMNIRAATSPDVEVRLGHTIGVLMELRGAARRAGFVPN